MAIQALKPQGKEFVQAPKGRHQAVLIGIVDRGEQPNKFKDNALEPKLSFHFEIAEEDENGERYQISKWVTNSTWFSAKTGKMSALVDMLTQWLDMSAGEIGPAIFDDLECLCGLNARIRIVHNPREDGTGFSAKIASFEPWADSDGPLLAPSQPVGEGETFRPKSIQDVLDMAKGSAGLPAAPKAPKAPAKREADPRATNGGPSPRDVARDLAAGKEPPRLARPKATTVAELNDDEDIDDVFAAE
ncbi:MAG: hypothetical protein KY445_13820 [Armatimonadetes bacterium]|nr:hypothetical protein [Armatimonadota bacterium]